MTSHERMLSLVQRIYTAALDESNWPGVLECLADEYRGDVAGFQYRVGLGEVRLARFVRLDPALLAAMKGYYASRNPWVRVTQPLYRTGSVMALDQVLTPSALRRTEYYDGILRPIGLLHGFGACVLKRGDAAVSFTAVRSPSIGPYEEAELNRVRAVLPHLRRAVQVNERLSQLRHLHAALADGLESLHHGVIVVGRSGLVVFANRAARAIAAQQDGLSISADGLVAAALADRRRLRALVDDAVRTAIGEGFGHGGVMTIARPSLKRPFLVLVAPLPLALAGNEPTGLATIFVSDPEERAEAAPDLLRRVYGLSPREAQVAQAFSASGSLNDVVDTLHVNNETARWHLKNIYRKTGTSGQSALVRLLAGLSQVTTDGPSHTELGRDR